MREAVLRCFLEAARHDQRIVLLCGDHGYALLDEFRSTLPGQLLNCGIAEQNMVGVASGLAKAGFRPIIYGLASFIPMRVLEQIKLDICYENRRVIFIGDGAGLVYAQLGISHQCCEDIGALRSLQDMTILSPADRYEAAACSALALATEGPVYVRVGKCDLGDIHSDNVELRPRELIEVLPGRGDIAWLATGSMVQRALSAARRWPGSAVWSFPCIKPLDDDHVRAICRKHKIIVTVEEHAREGGLGSAVCEIACEVGSARVCRIGVDWPFFEFCGSYDYLIQQHGLDVESIAARVGRFAANRHGNRQAYAA